MKAVSSSLEALRTTTMCRRQEEEEGGGRDAAARRVTDGRQWCAAIMHDRCRTPTQSSSQSMSCIMTVGEVDDGGARRREAAWAL
jgi:hypothetical protein